MFSLGSSRGASSRRRQLTKQHRTTLSYETGGAAERIVGLIVNPVEGGWAEENSEIVSDEATPHIWGRARLRSIYTVEDNRPSRVIIPRPITLKPHKGASTTECYHGPRCRRRKSHVATT